jgi:hypothetical protein
MHGTPGCQGTRVMRPSASAAAISGP